MAKALRQLAKSEGFAVVLLSQLTRPEGINAKPSMLDMKDIEAHSHVLLLLPYLPVGA